VTTRSRGRRRRDLAGLALALLAAFPATAQDTATSAAQALEAARVEARAIEESGREPADLASALESLADRVTEMNHPGAGALATILLEKVLALRERVHGPESPSLVPTLERLSGLAYDSGEWGRCEALDRRVLALRLEHVDEGHPDVAAARQNLALTLYRLDRAAEAEPLLRAAAAALERLDPPRQEALADALGYLAESLRAQGRYKEAEALFVRALELGPGDPSTVLSNLAGLHRDANRYGEALVLLSRALAIEEARDPPVLAELVALWNNTAELYRFQGDLREAEQYYRKAVAGAREAFGPAHPRYGTMLSQLAELLREAGRVGEAEPLYRDALSLKSRALGPDHPSVAHTHEGLGRMLSSVGRLDAAEAELRASLRIRETRLGPRHPECALARLAVAELLDGLPARRLEAQALLDSLIADLGSSPAEARARARGLALRARMRQRAGDRAGARADLSHSLDIVDALRPEVGGGARTRARYSAGYAADFAQLARWLADDGNAEGAFEVLERFRARTLLDELAAGRVDFKSGIDPSSLPALEAREARLLASMAATRDALSRLDMAAGARGYAEERRLLDERLSRAETEYQRLYEDMRNASRLWRGFAARDGAPSLREVQARIVPPGGLLLSYLVDDDGVLLFVVPPVGRPDVVPLAVSGENAGELRVPPGPLTLGTLQRVLAPEAIDPGSASGLLGLLGRAPVTGRGRPAVERALHGLWRSLVPEATWERVKASSEVVVVPDRILHRLPFEALVVSRTADGPRYWLDEGPPVRYAASAAALLTLTSRPPATRGQDLVSVFDPAYAPRGGGGDAPAALGKLPGTAVEAAAVRAAFLARAALGVTTLSGPDAREPRVRAALQEGRYLHLAVHGLVDETRSELFAALALASPAGQATPADDGLLQLHEIYELRLDAELAVLSACESRVGEVLAGEGAFALSRAFLVSGARRVVASAWPAEDLATARLFASFFREIASAGLEAPRIDHAAALARAKLEVRGRPDSADPFFWAAFLLEGAP
jgi:tetratricopeptide (TPR) repeat protein